ncbi:MAG: CRISPR-associated protein Cas5, partial [Gammaproteobacteria bacterium]|nr:CRISPR-associated protein Cas5 [Gammaproteobacteria bacterium]
MKLNQVGFVGWRGMVGSVLLQRMRAEGDFAAFGQPVFFSTSQAGQPVPGPVAELAA